MVARSHTTLAQQYKVMLLSEDGIVEGPHDDRATRFEETHELC